VTDITILTRARISAESGLGTFRDEGGLWSQYGLEEVATLELNLDPSDTSPLFAERRMRPASRIVPDWVEEVLPQQG